MHKKAKFTPRIDARLSTYATLAGVALAAPALAPSAEAAIVSSGPVSINIPTTTAGVYLNVVTGVSNASPTSAPGWDLNLWGSGGLFAYGNTTADATSGSLQNFAGGNSATLADNLPVGTLINSTYSYGNGQVETAGATAFTLSSTANYVGFRFLNEATGQIDYGWAQLSLSTSYIAQPRTIIRYAYENTGLPLVVGVVPEPTTVAMLGVMAAGAVGVRQWRRRKSA